MKAENGTYTSLAGQVFGGSLPTGAWAMTIDESVIDQQMALAARLGGGDVPKLTTSTATGAPLRSSDRLTLLIDNAEVRFDFLVVIETVR